LAKIVIGKADPDKVLPYNVIRIPCKGCRESTLHDRVVRDRTTGKYRPVIAKFPERREGNKAYWKCRKCGTITKF